MTKSRDEGMQLAALMDAVAESIISATDRELIEDAKSQGIDMKAESVRVSNVLDRAILSAKKKRLQAAQVAHAQSVNEISKRESRIPSDSVAKRWLLDRVVKRKPGMQQTVMTLTLQHRDFKELSDRDVDSALRQLDALGLIDDDIAVDE